MSDIGMTVVLKQHLVFSADRIL